MTEQSGQLVRLYVDYLLWEWGFGEIMSYVPVCIT